jgi:hypothetical protein
MVLIKFKKTYKIGSNHYSEIETYLFNPNILKKIINKLPAEEYDNKKKIVMALVQGKYKRTPGNIYFVPPLLNKHNTEMITHIIIAKSSIEEIEQIIQAPIDDPTKNKLLHVITNKLKKQYPINSSSMPYKKRKLK